VPQLLPGKNTKAWISSCAVVVVRQRLQTSYRAPLIRFRHILHLLWYPDPMLAICLVG
jgi:hypothetical protein